MPNVTRFLGDLARRYRSHGLTAVPWATSRVHEYVERNAGPVGRLLRRNDTNVFERDWDLLVILDACRVDSLRALTSEPEFDLFDAEASIRSVGSFSRQWMERTFRPAYEAEMRRTAYVNGNPHSDLCLDASEFQRLDDVWKTDWDDDAGTIAPEPLTDRAIHVARSDRPDRMIVHYMQPHFPSIPHPDLASGIRLDRVGSKWRGNIWDRLRDGELEEARVRTAYEDNLRYVLRDVKRLFENVDAERAVVTADHGTAFGERGFYGHQPTSIDCVRRVPWFETTAEDRQTVTPEVEPVEASGEQHAAAVDDRLQALGYKR